MPTAEDRKSTIHRLRRLGGQIGGLERMITEEKDCEEILVQLLAAKEALNKIALQIISHTMKDCLAAKSPDRTPEEVIAEAMDLFMRYAKAVR
jgi:DNA-binding FrmR family transcriptional regulator